MNFVIYGKNIEITDNLSLGSLSAILRRIQK